MYMPAGIHFAPRPVMRVFLPEAWNLPCATQALLTILKCFLALLARLRETPGKTSMYSSLLIMLRTSSPISAAKWAECRGPDDWRALREKMRGRPCYLGVDLAETNDMVGLVAWFPEDRVVLPWYWGCERAASERFKRNEPVYYRWRDAGALDLVSDDAIELAPIVAKVEELKTTYEVLGMGVDRAKALEFTFAVQKFGIAPTFVGQGYLTMTEPCDRLVAMVENRRFVHGGHPVLNWNAENLRFKVTGQRAKQPQKPTEAQKIDGIAAWLTALALTMGDAVANAAPPASVEFVSLVRPGRGDFDDEEF